MRTALCLALAGCATTTTPAPGDTSTTDPGSEVPPDTTDTTEPTGTTPTTPPRDPCTTDVAEPLLVECVAGYSAVPAADGDEVTIISGYQGGWMIMASVLTESVSNVALIEPTLSVPEVSDRNIALGGYTGALLDGWAEGTCVGQPYPLQVVFDPYWLPGGGSEAERICNLVGHTLHLQMDVTDPTSGRTGSCAVDLVVSPESC